MSRGVREVSRAESNIRRGVREPQPEEPVEEELKGVREGEEELKGVREGEEELKGVREGQEEKFVPRAEAFSNVLCPLVSDLQRHFDSSDLNFPVTDLIINDEVKNKTFGSLVFGTDPA